MRKLPTPSFKNLPAIPVDIGDALKTLVSLGERTIASKQALQGLTTFYEIEDTVATAYNFLYGKKLTTEDADARDEMARALGHGLDFRLVSTLNEHIFGDPNSSSFLRFVTGFIEEAVEHFTGESGDDESEEAQGDPLTKLSLEEPEQFSMAWTVEPDVHHSSKELLPKFAATLKDAEAATQQFWPTISEYGLSYNLLIAQKLGSSDLPDPRAQFVDVWKSAWDTLEEKGLLYAIDMTIFDGFKPREVDGLTRFTPGTVTLLEQNPDTKDLTPIAVRVASFQGEGKQVYVRGEATPSAWIYALQAAKVSITVYGIWLGHVYHWHVVTAAMQFTMLKVFSKEHPIFQLLAPSSKYLVGFDTVLLLLWKSVAPPTAINTPRRFLKLCDHFAEGRSFFDDDPTVELERLGISEADFTDKEPWDKYAFVPYLLKIWDIVDTYTNDFVEATYASDQDIQQDDELQEWIKRSGERRQGGNIRGLPKMDSKEALHRVLRSFLYRITAHGNSRLSKSANPGLTFVGNYPPCLQDASIPAPESTMTTKELLQRMPVTGTIAGMVTFYFTFSFSVPYEPLIPIEGFDENLFFEGGMDDDRNKALVRFRGQMVKFIQEYSPVSPQIYQWPLNIET
jgi:hypothetical protein